MPLERVCYAAGEIVAIYCEGGTGRDLRLVGCPQYDRIEPAHLFLEHPDRGLHRSVAQRVGTHKFREPAGSMGFGHPHRTHFIQSDWHAAPSELPCGLATGKSCTDYVYACMHNYKREEETEGTRRASRPGGM